MEDGSGRDEGRRYLPRYALLTVFLFAPLLWSFAALRNLYPFAAWTVMTSPGEAGRGRTYYVLRGETLAGETVDLRAVELTDALGGRVWGMFGAAVENGGFKIRSPHPANAAMIEAAGGVGGLPAGARLPELLGAYGGIYNSRLHADSPRRLKAVRLEAYRWGGGFADHGTFVRSWRQEL
jgi:hypothetical protein